MVRRQSKLLTKRGAYGSSKCKAFSIMLDGRWYPSRQLCIFSGIRYCSLGRTLSRWYRFDYLDRRDIAYGGDYIYSLTVKGKKWLSLAKRYLHNYQLFMDELQNWQKELPSMPVDELLNMPFKEFIASLDGMIKEFQKNNGENA